MCLNRARSRQVKQLACQAIRWLETAAKGDRPLTAVSAAAAAPPAVLLQKGSEIGGPILPSNSNTGDVADNRILDYCLFLRRQQQSVDDIRLLTGDRNLALKALAEEVRSIAYTLL